MNQLYAGNMLRTTRLEVAKQMPELAPQLADNNEVVCNAVIASLQKQGAEITDADWPNILRTEQHSYVSYLMTEQKDLLVDGEGQDAIIKHPVLLPDTLIKGRMPERFQPDFRQNFFDGYATLAGRHSDQTDPQNNWWWNVNKRHEDLGIMVYLMISKKRNFEALQLDEALTSPTLGAQIGRLATFVRLRMPQAEEEQRIQAAHDLSYLMYIHAGMHAEDFATSPRLSMLDAGITRDEARGKYVLDRSAPTQKEWGEVAPWEEVFARRHPRADDKLSVIKCPVHTMVQEEQTETSLVTLGHAGINLAATYGQFALAGSNTITMSTLSKLAQ